MKSVNLGILHPVRVQLRSAHISAVDVAGVTFLGTILYLEIHLVILMACIVAGAVLLARRFPLATCLAFLALGVLPNVFLAVPVFAEGFGLVGFGIRPMDIVLLGMLGAVTLAQFIGNAGRSGTGLKRIAVVFAIWVAFEVARNIPQYGLSAPGEFRFSYLILALPIYVGLHFPTAEMRVRLLKVLIGCSLLFPITMVPLLGALNAGIVGVEGRFFPATISLGIALGVLALGIAHRHGIVRLKLPLLWMISLLAGAILVSDGHRSVWIFVGASLLFLIARKEVGWKTVAAGGALLVTAYGILALGFPSVIRHFLDFLGERLLAFLSPEQDPTARWRLALWYSALETIARSPFLGEGFGGYWAFVTPGLGVVTQSPHNLYIQALVKIGLIGLFIYLVLIVKTYRQFIQTLVRQPAQSHQVAFLTIGSMTLVASHLYFVAYAFDLYSGFYIGLAVAATLGDTDRVGPKRVE